MTIKEVKEYHEGQYVECEIYRFTDFTHRVHSDFIYTPDDVEDDQYNENEEVVYEELMDEEEYGRTVIANGDVTADFDDWFGDKNAQILVIMLHRSAVTEALKVCFRFVDIFADIRQVRSFGLTVL